jgi:hypothetical protein
MDMRSYMGTTFIKPKDVPTPRQDQIVDISIGNYDKPVATLKGGGKLSLNATNCSVLGRAYGPDSDDWVDKTIELYVGQVEFKGEMQDSVLVRPISPPVPQEQGRQPQDGRDDLADEIPF